MSLNVAMLKSVYNDNRAAKAILNSFSGRQRNVSETKVNNLASELVDYSYWEVLEASRKIADTGAGKFIVGRRGSQSRVAWEVPIVNLGKVAKGDINDIDAVSSARMIEHTYTVRPGLTVKIELPADLTQNEASRLGDFVRTLSFT
jgi:hypothetical protein